MSRTLTRFAALALVTQAACSQPSPEERSGASPSVPTVTYGAVMVDIAHRFEVFGRAIQAERFELAEYELGEIEEVFDEVLPKASPPREGHPEELPALREEFLGGPLPDLRRAMKTPHQDHVTAAFGRAAAACNACHQASGHGFIEVPSVPGRRIPDTSTSDPEAL